MWDVHWSNRLNKETRNLSGITVFYLLPTIEYFRDRTFDDEEDYSFNITFEWLFCSLTFTKYWGESYKKYGRTKK